MRYIFLILGIMAAIDVVYTFISSSNSNVEIIGFKVNIWIYRLFWTVAAISLIAGFFKLSKNASKLK